MNNQIKITKKELLPKRRESDDKNAVAIVKNVSQLGCVSQDSDVLVSEGRKSLGNPMQEVLEPSRRIPTQPTLRQASSREKGPLFGTSQNSSSAKSYAIKIDDRFQESARQHRCAQSKAKNLANNIYKLKEKDKAAFYIPAVEWVLPAASTNEPEER